MESTNIYGIKQQSNLSKSANDFIQSNDMVSNVIFILVLLVVSIILFNIIMKTFLHYLLPTNSPHLIDGMVDTKDSEVKIVQDPNISTSKTILMSNNEDKGLEFTWSFWIYIDELDYKRGELKNVFVKGDNIYKNSSDANKYQEDDYEGDVDDYVNDELNNNINSPGVYLTPFDNKLLFVFNTFDSLIEKFEIGNIPMNKWVNVVIRCENKTIDVFLNSTFTKRHVLTSLPKQNYNNVYIGKNGGFAGFVSDLWYFNHSLGTQEISKLYKNGASTNLLNDKTKKASGSDSVSGLMNNYKLNWLSFRWFSN
jgi:hypothetical protein